MRRLLKNTTQRRLAIIGVLRDLIGWQNPEMIADLLECSVKTILSDVDAINNLWGRVFPNKWIKIKRCPSQ